MDAIMPVMLRSRWNFRIGPAPLTLDRPCMNILLFLIPVALLLAATGLVAFVWALKSGQFDDLDGAAWRAIMDDDDKPDDFGKDQDKP